MSRQERGVNARGVGEGVGSVAKGVGHIGRFDGVPLVVIRMCIEVVVDWCVGWSVVEEQVAGDVAKSFGRAEEGVIVGAVAYLFTPDSILLVREREGCVGDTLDGVLIMQRCFWADVDFVINGEGDVAEVKGLGACFRVGRVEVLGWLQQPKEGDNDEVDGGAVECAFNGVVGVQGINKSLEDGDVGRVGVLGGLVLVLLVVLK